MICPEISTFCRFDTEDRRHGQCMECDQFDSINSCRAANFTVAAFSECVSNCVEFGDAADANSPDGRIRKLADKFEEVTNELVTQRFFRQAFAQKQLNKINVVARTMMSWRRAWQNTCQYPTGMIVLFFCGTVPSTVFFSR